MNTIPIPYTMFVGIDVGSEELVTFIRDASSQSKHTLMQSDDTSAKVETYPQSKSGYWDLTLALRRYAKQRGIPTKEILITIEATGTYWLRPASYLYNKGFDIQVINPASARHYAGMKLKRSKSDPIDAKVLASLGLIYAVDDNIDIRLWHEPSDIYDELQQRVKLFTEVSKLIVQTSNRKHARSWRSVNVDEVREREKDMVDFLRAHKEALHKEITSLLFSNTEWRQNAEILMSIPGFGAIVTAQMLIITQNFTLFATCAQLQSYCGLVPREQSSGKMQKHKRIGHAGNKTMRGLLFLSAQTACNHDAYLKDYKERLTQEDTKAKNAEDDIRPNKGKASTVAHVAVARKLVRIAWSCVKNGTPYDPDYRENRIA